MRCTGIEFFAGSDLTSFVEVGLGSVVFSHCYFHMDPSLKLVGSAFALLGGEFAIVGSWIRFAFRSSFAIFFLLT
jgi:hypothetical protein